ncbi:ribonuclease T2 family protein [Novosphingobium sp. 9]|uniref:ribonuclease T2 family protein n=1 Tax=Novosphingobium sp. 9 TaxID=2025349 RepID=UPI0021B682FE|nr:ribonuclease T [Novosphingobium sp. 9]
MRLAAAALVAAAAAISPLPVFAQAYQCRVPATIPTPRPVTPDGPVRRGVAVGYTLAASWSPEYCHFAHDKGSMQCSGRQGRFGFVLHGLWPEGGAGGDPQWCGATPPSVQALRGALCMTPSPSLLAHEWTKHGSCMARSPEGYFRVSGILWRSLHWPDADFLSRKRGLVAGDLRDAFVAENPGWRRDAVGVVANRSGWLREVQLCTDRHFRPARCDARRFGAADGAPLKIWRGL